MLKSRVSKRRGEATEVKVEEPEVAEDAEENEVVAEGQVEEEQQEVEHRGRRADTDSYGKSSCWRKYGKRLEVTGKRHFRKAVCL